MWRIILIFYFGFGASSYLLRRVLAQRLGDHNRIINAVFFVAFLLPLGLILSLFFPHNLGIGWTNIALLLGGSLIWPLFNISAFKANKHVDVGIYTIINNLSPLMTLFVALTFLNERLHVIQFIGIALLIFSGLIVVIPKLGRRSKADLQGILFCLFATILLGLAVAYERFMLNRVDFGAYLIYGWGAQIMWAVILAIKELKFLPKLFEDKTSKQIIFWYGLTNALKSAAFITALKLSNSASIISAATDFMAVVVVLSAYFALKEQEHLLLKLSAALLGAGGLILILK